MEGKHVFYVWFDALIGYMSAVDGEDLWPADLHLIGKEIVRFHAVFWPAFLMAAELPLPKRIFAHGWLLFENDKMSKSRGNIVRSEPIRQVMGADALRYFLLREIVFGQDGSFSYDALVGRYNSDLANGLGNLASRTLTMIHQYREGRMPAGAGGDPEIAALADGAIRTVQRDLRPLRVLQGTGSRLEPDLGRGQVHRAAGALEAGPPAGRGSQRQLDATLYTSAEALRIATALLAPVLPQSAPKIWTQLGMSDSIESMRFESLAWGGLAAGQKIGEVAAVFPRIEAKEAIAKMRELEERISAEQKALVGQAEAPNGAGRRPRSPSTISSRSICGWARC